MLVERLSSLNLTNTKWFLDSIETDQKVLTIKEDAEQQHHFVEEAEIISQKFK